MTKTTKRKREEAWLLFDNDGTSPDWSFDPPTKAGREWWTRNGRRIVHLVEEDAAELRALQRVAKAAESAVNMKLSDSWQSSWTQLEHAVAAMKKRGGR